MAFAEQLSDDLKKTATLLDDPSLDPNPERRDWHTARDALGAVRTTFDRALGLLDAAAAELRDANDQARLREGLCEIAAELAALLQASADRSGAEAMRSRALRLATEPSRQAELQAAGRDFASFVLLARARWLMRHERVPEARRILAVLAKSREPAFAQAAGKVLDAPQPLKAAPALFTFNGFGVSLYGGRDQRSDGSRVSTTCLCALFVPLFPLAAYRVVPQGGGRYLFLSRERLSRFARAWQRLVVAATLLVVAGFAVTSYRNSPSRRFSQAIAAAVRIERQGRADEAIARYTASIRQYSGDVDARRLQAAAARALQIAAARVASPFGPAQVEQAARVRLLFDSLPPAATRGRPSAVLLARIERWIGELGDATLERSQASLRLYDLASGLAQGSRQEVLTRRRDELRLAVARQLATDWPLSALEEFAQVGASRPAIEGALVVIDTIAGSPSLLAEAAPSIDTWSAAAAAQTDLQPRIARVTERLAEVRRTGGEKARRDLLDSRDEAKLRAALGRQAGDQEVAVALAGSERARGDVAAAIRTLTGLGPLGRTIGAAQHLLGVCYSDAGRLAEADRTLGHFVERRLAAFQRARRAYVDASRDRQERIVEQARARLPDDLGRRIEGVAEPERPAIFERWLVERMQQDPQLAALKAAYEGLGAVVAASLTLGMVKLQRAAAATGGARRALLDDAERIFLSIRQEAEGEPGFHLGLGQVYHRLGRPEEGDRELNGVIAGGDPGLKLAVAQAYRELGLEGRARQIAEAVFRDSPSPARENAALAMSMLADELEERELWLGRADANQVFVRRSLENVRAQREFLAGSDAAADSAFARVVAEYAREATHSSASANNAAMALQQRYACTGDREHLVEAVRQLEAAQRLEPDNALIAGNLAEAVAYLGHATVLDRWIQTRRLRLDARGIEDLLDGMATGALREEVFVALRQDPSLRRSAEMDRRQELLAPSNVSPYLREWQALDRVDDVEGLRGLLERIGRVASIDTTRQDERRRSFEAGREDARQRRYVASALRRSERAVAEAQRAGHAPTLAAAEVMQGAGLLARSFYDDQLADAVAAVEAYRAADRAWPAIGARRALVRALCHIAVVKASRESAPVARARVERGRALGPELLLYVLAVKEPAGDVVAALRRQAELLEAASIRLADIGPRPRPRMLDWVLARAAGNAELERLAGPAFQREAVRLGVQVGSRLDPERASTPLMIELLRLGGGSVGAAPASPPRP